MKVIYSITKKGYGVLLQPMYFFKGKRKARESFEVGSIYSQDLNEQLLSEIQELGIRCEQL